MPDSSDDVPIPTDYSPLEGSERRSQPGTTSRGPANPNEIFTVTIVLRRRLNHEPLPDFKDFLKPVAAQRRPLSNEEFARSYGASDEDVNLVKAFAKAQGLEIVEDNKARRTVVVKGTVAQMSRAFATTLRLYEHEIVISRGSEPQRVVYRGREGKIYVPKELIGIIVGVFGLDNRSVAKANCTNPPNTKLLTVADVAGFYNYPANSAAGQTIGVVSMTKYDIKDIEKYFNGPNGFPKPVIKDVKVHDLGPNSSIPPISETTHNICVAASFAPGAVIAVYHTSCSQQGFVDAIKRVVLPQDGDPLCTVLCCSWFMADGDDPIAIGSRNVSTDLLNQAHGALKDAAIKGITVCVASGDHGADSTMGDGLAHVQYPASDPWVLSVGGTTIGNLNVANFDEYVWNDKIGATGGGVSGRFPLPGYQGTADVPDQLNNSFAGRGVPDVAGNASPDSGYSGMVFNGAPSVADGTSAAAPQWAGLIARINAALSVNVGFINPALYQLGMSVCRAKAAAGPRNNSFSVTIGYKAGSKWDPCTGWGSPDGMALLKGLRRILNP